MKQQTLKRVLPALLAVAALLAGCASSSHRAPIEDRPPAAAAVRPPAAVASAPDSAASKPLPLSENAGKPGYHTTRPGDTLIRIALEYGQNWRDVARWNNLDNPNLIEVGQVLRVLPPPGETVAAVKPEATARPVTPPPRVEAKPLSPPSTAASGVQPSPPSAAASAVVAAAAPATPPAREPDEDMTWAWPAAGPVAAQFDDARNKGVAITGKAGDPVYASADGRVVYAGSGLRGYGNLIIVKHNATYLSAYAHNQTLLVKEDQVVRRGQKIAEMGSSDADRVQLHFEIRRQGKPIDPTRLLPPR